jgi:MFS family permease
MARSMHQQRIGMRLTTLRIQGTGVPVRDIDVLFLACIRTNIYLVKKACHIVPVSLLCLSVTAGSSMITPGVFAIVHKFHVSHTAALLPLSLFVLGLAIGPMLAAPISETRGRAIVYKVSIPLYMLFILGAGLSNSFAGLLVCRTLAAIAGAPCLAVGAGTVADLFEPKRMAAPGALVVMAPFLGPCKYNSRTLHHSFNANQFLI